MAQTDNPSTAAAAAPSAGDTATPRIRKFKASTMAEYVNDPDPALSPQEAVAYIARFVEKFRGLELNPTPTIDDGVAIYHCTQKTGHKGRLLDRRPAPPDPACRALIAAAQLPPYVCTLDVLVGELLAAESADAPGTAGATGSALTDEDEWAWSDASDQARTDIAEVDTMLKRLHALTPGA